MGSIDEKKIPVFLDVDTGHDDAFAVLLAAYHPKSHLIGISTVHGNASLTHTTHNTLAILEAINRSDVPVYSGAGKPLRREACHAEGIHGATGLDGTTLLPQPSRHALQYSPTETLDRIEQMLMQYPANTVYLVATGTLTNIYNLMTQHPHLVNHIAGLSIMGGAIGGGFTDAPLGSPPDGLHEQIGNWTPYAEFNIYCDPEAAQGIFAIPALAAKTTLITLDLSHKCLATPAVQKQLLQGTRKNNNTSLRNPQLRRLMNEILVFFADTYRSIFGLPAPPLHDPLAVLAVLEPALFLDERGKGFRVSVETEGERYDAATNKFCELGRTRADAVGNVGVRIPTAVDLGAFWGRIDDALEVAES